MAQQVKDEQSLDNNYINASRRTNCKDAPIDLSRHCDSVETRKTPSPYNSSSFGENSPSTMSDSPKSLTRNVRATLLNRRSPNPYHLNDYDEATYPMSTFGGSSIFSAFMKSNKLKASTQHTESIDQCFSYMDNAASHLSSSSINVMNPFVVQALQQKLQIMSAPEATNKPTTPSQERISNSSYPMIMGLDGKLSRPFKAYPKNPLSIAAYVPPADSLIDQKSSERYSHYRNRVMHQILATKESRANASSPKMRRTSLHRASIEYEHQHDSDSIPAPQQLSDVHSLSGAGSPTDSADTSHGPIKDSAYYERRRKNNAAAKKSRDRRRIKEDEIAIRAAILERENMELKIELTAIKRQLSLYMNK